MIEKVLRDLDYPQNPNWSKTGIWISRRGMPFGFDDGAALAVDYVGMEPQAVLKLHLTSKW